MIQPPFQWNTNAFGGTEYMARNFNKLILDSVPKLNNYLCLIIPGLMPTLEQTLAYKGEIILWMHNTPIQFGQEFISYLKHPEFLAKVKYVIALSEFEKQEIVNQLGIDKSKIYIIGNAIHPLQYNSSKFDKPKEIKLINTSSPDRGLDVLLEAVKLVDEDFRLEIYNRFNPDEIWDFEADPRIKFYGFTPKAVVREAYEAAHIHAYPSTYPETFCISQAEAMSAGNLCVTSDLGALPEVSAGHTSIYEYLDNKTIHTKVFAKRLEKAIKQVKSGEWNPEKQIKYVNNNYSWEAVKQEWIKFHKLL
jgi:glycosyltransferase involved in cell wall biosynthesis